MEHFFCEWLFYYSLGSQKLGCLKSFTIDRFCCWLSAWLVCEKGFSCGGIFYKGQRSIKNKSVLRSEVDLRDFFSVTASSSCLSSLYVFLIFLISLINSLGCWVCLWWESLKVSVGLNHRTFIITLFLLHPAPLHSTSSSCTPYLPPPCLHKSFTPLIQAPSKQLSTIGIFCRTKLIFIVYSSFWLIFGYFWTKAKQDFLTSPLYVPSGRDFESSNGLY